MKQCLFSHAANTAQSTSKPLFLSCFSRKYRYWYSSGASGAIHPEKRRCQARTIVLKGP